MTVTVNLSFDLRVRGNAVISVIRIGNFVLERSDLLNEMFMIISKFSGSY